VAMSSSTGVASGHLVNLSMATYRYRYPPTALGKGPKIYNCDSSITCKLGTLFVSVKYVLVSVKLVYVCVKLLKI
jgi:hypothetical protein